MTRPASRPAGDKASPRSRPKLRPNRNRSASASRSPYRRTCRATAPSTSTVRPASFATTAATSNSSRACGSSRAERLRRTAKVLPARAVFFGVWRARSRVAGVSSSKPRSSAVRAPGFRGRNPCHPRSRPIRSTRNRSSRERDRTPGRKAAYSQRKTAQSSGRSPIAGTTRPVAATTVESSNASTQAAAHPGSKVQESSVSATTSPEARSRPTRRILGTDAPGSSTHQTRRRQESMNSVTRSRGATMIVSTSASRDATVHATAIAESVATTTTLRLGPALFNAVQAPSGPDQISHHLAHRPDRQEQHDQRRHGAKQTDMPPLAEDRLRHPSRQKRG